MVRALAEELFETSNNLIKGLVWALNELEDLLFNFSMVPGG